MAIVTGLVDGAVAANDVIGEMKEHAAARRTVKQDAQAAQAQA